MSTQIQIRGATAGTQNARVLASRVLDIDTTEERLCTHNGSRAGGMPHVNARDALHNEYGYAVASGTDAITVTYNFAPTAWAAGMGGKFKAVNTNTGSATFNPNGIGAKTFKKIKNGALVALDEGDIVQNMIHEWDYNGSDLILLNPGTGSGAAGWVEVASYTVTPGDATIALDWIGDGGLYDKYEVLWSGISGSASFTAARMRLAASGTEVTTGYEQVDLADSPGYSSSGHFPLQTKENCSGRIFVTPAGDVGLTLAEWTISRSGVIYRAHGTFVGAGSFDGFHFSVQGSGSYQTGTITVKGRQI